MQLDLAGDASQQKALIFDSGSFTGRWRPPLSHPGAANGYLTATDKFNQPLCGNQEGWGPLSPFRYDFTPCFIDVWVASVAVFGLVFGLGAVVWLVKTKKPTGVAKGWHFWTKQVCAHFSAQTSLRVNLESRG